MTTSNRKSIAAKILLAAIIAIFAAIALSLCGCGITKPLTDPEARMNRLLGKHPELVGKMFHNDTLYQRHDSTIYIPGASDTVLLPGLERLLPGHTITIIRDTGNGLQADVWRDLQNQLHLSLTKRPDSVKVEWRDRDVNHYHTQIVTETPEWAKLLLGIMGALVGLSVIIAYLVFRYNRKKQ